MRVSSPRRFLFVLWEGGGNVPLQLALARGLAERGHDVRVLSEDCLAVDVLASDYMLFGPPIAAERAGVPTALLVHNIYVVPEPGKPAPGPGFLPARGPLGRIRDRAVARALVALFNRGLPPVNSARSEH